MIDLKTATTRLHNWFIRQNILNGIVIFTIGFSIVNEYLFHLGLLLIFMNLLLTPKSQEKVSHIYWVYFWLIMQYPIVLIFRRAISLELDMSFWEDILRWTLMACIPLIVASRGRKISFDTIKKSAQLVLILGFLVSIWDVVVLNLDRAQGSEHPINMAIVLTIMASILFYELISKQINRFQEIIVSIIILLLGMYAIILTQARGALLALVATYACVTLFELRNIIKKPKTLIGLFIIFSIAIFSGGILLTKLNLLERTIAEINTYNSGQVTGSFGTRIEMWKSAIDIFLQHPILGVDENTKTLQKQGGVFIQYSPVVSQWAHMHNEIFEAMAKRGLLGLLSILNLWTLPVIIFLSYRKKLNPIPFRNLAHTQIVLLAWFFCGLTQVFTHHNIGVTFLPLLIGLTIFSALRDS